MKPKEMVKDFLDIMPIRIFLVDRLQSLAFSPGESSREASEVENGN